MHKESTQRYWEPRRRVTYMALRSVASSVLDVISLARATRFGVVVAYGCHGSPQQ